jgi:hypothetical protein
MTTYHVTAATMIIPQPAISPYRHGAAVLFQPGINAFRWFTGALRTNWESHDMNVEDV